MKIKCVASIYDAYYKVVEVSVGKYRRRKVVKVSSRNNNKYTYLTKNSENNSGNFLICNSIRKIFNLSVFLVAVLIIQDEGNKVNKVNVKIIIHTFNCAFIV